MDDDPTPVSTSRGLSVEESGKAQNAYNASIIAAPGAKVKMHEDDNVMVSCLTDYRGHQGRIQIVVYNKGMFDLGGLKFEIPDSPSFTIKTQTPVSTNIFPNDEAKLLVAIECMRPFTAPPALNIYLSIQGRGKLYDLQLPLAVSSFYEAMPTSKDVYMQRWKALEANKIEVTEIFQCNIDVDENLVNKMRTNLIPRLRIGYAEGLDNALTLTGCASFKTGTTGPDGNLIAQGVMLRIEADKEGNRFRVRVRAKHQMIAEATKDILKAQLVF
jgi:hypothetical protein